MKVPYKDWCNRDGTKTGRILPFQSLWNENCSRVEEKLWHPRTGNLFRVRISTWSWPAEVLAAYGWSSLLRLLWNRAVVQTFHFFVRVELDNYHVSHWLTSDALKDSSSNQTHLPVGVLVKESCFERFSGKQLACSCSKASAFSHKSGVTSFFRREDAEVEPYISRHL